jgi:hypothetical protein
MTALYDIFHNTINGIMIIISHTVVANNLLIPTSVLLHSDTNHSRCPLDVTVVQYFTGV